MARASGTVLVLVMASHRLAATLVLSTSILATLAACGDPAGPKSNEPPRVNVAITIGDTIRGESLESAGHVDGFTFQGQQGDELIGYVRTLATDPRAVIRMVVYDTRGEPLLSSLALATSDTVTDLQAHPSSRFTLPATGQYTVVIGIESRPWAGGSPAPYPRGYEFQLRRIVRTPETTSGTIVPGDTVSVEAIDYVGDIDELTLVAPNGGDFNLFLERPGSGRGSLTVTVLDLSTQPAAAAHPPAAPLHATATGTFTIPAGATARIRVYGVDSDLAYRGPYRIFVYPVNRSPERAGSSLVIGDSVTSETIELPGDLDEFTLTVPATTLANFVVWRDTDEKPDLVRLQLFGSGGEQTTITEAERGAPGEKKGGATGTFSLAAGTYRLRIGGSDSRGTGYRGAYRVQTLAIDPAPEGGPSALAFGDTVMDAVEPLGDIDRFTFAGRAGQHVSVRVETLGSPLIIFAGVENPRTNKWLDQDWYGGGTGTPRYDLPEDGEYVIEYQAANAGRGVIERGPYRLILDTVSTAPETHGRAISPGDSVVDESFDFIGDIDRFVLTGAPGEELAVTFISPGGEAYLDLVDLETGLPIDGAVSSGWLENTGRFVLPASGQLGTRVWTRGNSEFNGLTGPYRLEVLRIDRRPETVSAQIEVDSIIGGEAIDPDADVDEFTFNGVAGNRVEVYFQTPLGSWFEGLVLELINPATGAVLGSVRSQNPTQQLEAQGTGPVVLPSTGSYMIRVRGSSDSRGNGQYRMQVKSLS